MAKIRHGGGRNHRPGCRCPFCASGVRAEAANVSLTDAGLDDASPFGFEMDAQQMQALLGELDARLRARGVAASVYVVGGAAMTLAYGRETLTPDIDAVASHVAVREEAAAISAELGIPETWLNDNAQKFVPPRPVWAVAKPTEPGLTVFPAPPRHVLAMKLVAMRAKDRPDIRLLVEECEMADATPDDYAALLVETFGGEGRLADALGVPGNDDEAALVEARRIGELVIARVLST